MLIDKLDPKRTNERDSTDIRLSERIARTWQGVGREGAGMRANTYDDVTLVIGIHDCCFCLLLVKNHSDYN